DGSNPRLVLPWIEPERVKLRIAGDDVLDCRVACAVEERLLAGERIRRLRDLTKVRRAGELRPFKQGPLRKCGHPRDAETRVVTRGDRRLRLELRIRQAILARTPVRAAKR